MSTNKYLPEIPNALRDDKDPKKSKLSGFESGVDKLEDNIEKAQGQYAAISDAFTANQAVITAVYNTVTSDSVKQTALDLLGPAKKLVDTLDALGNIHPFVKVATGVFALVVTLELKRRENDRRIAALIDNMREMMQVLTKLKDIDTSKDNNSLETLQVDLGPLLTNIGTDINKAGNAIDTYYKQKFLVKFIASSHWEDKLVGMAKGFDTHKGKIQFTLQLHITVVIDTTAESVAQIQSKVDLLITLFRQKSAEEMKLEEAIRKKGGRETVINDRESLVEIANFAKELSSGDNDKSLPEDVDANYMYSLGANLDDLMEENRTLFQKKMEDLQSAIERSEGKILAELRAGAHERISHPEVQQLWHGMHWPTTVKARHFVQSLHDYYADRLSGVAQTLSADEHADAAEAIDVTHIDILQRDKWCLGYLSVRYVADISYAIDNDNSGFIRIDEANTFCKLVPQDWSLLQWIAFWAAGWRYEMATYRSRIAELWLRMQDMYEQVLPENRYLAVVYRNHYTTTSIGELIISLQETNCRDSNVTEITSKHMKMTETRLLQILESIKYKIDSSDSISSLFGETSLEKYILPLLYLTMKQHFNIMQLATKEVLDEREFTTMETTRDSIIEACWDHIRHLIEFYQLSNTLGENKEFFANFSHGIYYYLWNFSDVEEKYGTLVLGVQKFTEPQWWGIDDPDAPEGRIIVSDEVIENTKQFLRFPILPRHYGDSHFDQYFVTGLETFSDIEKEYIGLQVVLSTFVLLEIANHTQQEAYVDQPDSSAPAPEEIDVVETTAVTGTEPLTIPSEGTQPILNPTLVAGNSVEIKDLTKKEKKTAELEALLKREYLEYYKKIAYLEFRKTRTLGRQCNGCGMFPTVGIHWACIQCDDFDYCNACETGENVTNVIPGDHSNTHHILRIQKPISKEHLDKYKKESRDIVDEMNKNDNSKGEFPIGEDGFRQPYVFSDVVALVFKRHPDLVTKVDVDAEQTARLATIDQMLDKLTKQGSESNQILDKLTKQSSQLEQMVDKLTKQGSAFDNRLSRIEMLLEEMLAISKGSN